MNDTICVRLYILDRSEEDFTFIDEHALWTICELSQLHYAKLSYEYSSVALIKARFSHCCSLSDVFAQMNGGVALWTTLRAQLFLLLFSAFYLYCWVEGFLRTFSATLFQLYSCVSLLFIYVSKKKVSNCSDFLKVHQVIHLLVSYKAWGCWRYYFVLNELIVNAEVFGKKLCEFVSLKILTFYLRVLNKSANTSPFNRRAKIQVQGKKRKQATFQVSDSFELDGFQ